MHKISSLHLQCFSKSFYIEKLRARKFRRHNLHTTESKHILNLSYIDDKNTNFILLCLDHYCSTTTIFYQLVITLEKYLIVFLLVRLWKCANAPFISYSFRRVTSLSLSCRKPNHQEMCYRKQVLIGLLCICNYPTK